MVGFQEKKISSLLCCEVGGMNSVSPLLLGAKCGMYVYMYVCMCVCVVCVRACMHARVCVAELL